MPSLRSNSMSARIASAASTLAALLLLAAMPAGAGAAPTAQLAFEPAAQDFGLVAVNGSTEQATLQLRNTGSEPIQVFNTELAGGNGAFWNGWSDCPGRTLNGGESCSAQVYFGPWDAVPFTATLRAFAEGGVVVEAALSGEGGRPVFTPSANPVSFGTAPVGSTGALKTVELTNTGNMPGGLFIALISGGAVGSFQLVDEGCTATMILPGSTCVVQIRFAPVSTGVKVARLTLFGENDGGTQIVLNGVGLEPEPLATPASGGERVVASRLKRKRAKARGHARAKQRRALRRARKVAIAYRRTLR